MILATWWLTAIGGAALGVLLIGLSLGWGHVMAWNSRGKRLRCPGCDLTRNTLVGSGRFRCRRCGCAFYAHDYRVYPRPAVHHHLLRYGLPVLALVLLLILYRDSFLISVVVLYLVPNVFNLFGRMDFA